MSLKIDLIGKKFNKLLVLEEITERQNGFIMWLCQCECGNNIVVRGNSIKNGNTKSCGCLNKERVSKSVLKDLSGMVFNKLTVLFSIGRDKHRNVIWLCKCDCGNETKVLGTQLKSGNTKSCGCYNKSIESKFIGKNHPNWKGGISCEPYCEEWSDKEYKESIKERDGYKCLNPECNKIVDKLCIHHIDYNKKNCHPLNLITLCVSCNTKANKDREWHEAWYQTILNKRYMIRL